ncbi:MAG: hypothetical protein HDT36_00105 [Clostridiales bacterium]|nr:hypothetical protein [Clostridiales bacterium]
MENTNSNSTRIMLPPMTVTQNGREYPVLINQQFCYSWLKRVFFESESFAHGNLCGMEEDIKQVVSVFGALNFKELTHGKYELPSEFENIVLHTFEKNGQMLTVIVIPLDSTIKECDCNMAGFFKSGNMRIMYTSEYYSKSNEFQLCCFDDKGTHMPFGICVETIEQFKDEIFKLNGDTREC